MHRTASPSEAADLFLRLGSGRRITGKASQRPKTTSSFRSTSSRVPFSSLRFAEASKYKNVRVSTPGPGAYNVRSARRLRKMEHVFNNSCTSRHPTRISSLRERVSRRVTPAMLYGSTSETGRAGFVARRRSNKDAGNVHANNTGIGASVNDNNVSVQWPHQDTVMDDSAHWRRNGLGRPWCVAAPRDALGAFGSKRSTTHISKALHGNSSMLGPESTLKRLNSVGGGPRSKRGTSSFLSSAPRVGSIGYMRQQDPRLSLRSGIPTCSKNGPGRYRRSSSTSTIVIQEPGKMSRCFRAPGRRPLWRTKKLREGPKRAYTPEEVKAQLLAEYQRGTR